MGVTTKKFLLRLPAPLKEQLTTAAAAAGTANGKYISLNTFIVMILENTCSTPGPTPSSASPPLPPASFSSSLLQPLTVTTPTTGPPPVVFRTPA